MSIDCHRVSLHIILELPLRTPHQRGGIFFYQTIKSLLDIYWPCINCLIIHFWFVILHAALFLEAEGSGTALGKTSATPLIECVAVLFYQVLAVVIEIHNMTTNEG